MTLQHKAETENNYYNYRVQAHFSHTIAAKFVYGAET